MHPGREFECNSQVDIVNLLGRIKEQDEQALRELFERCANLVFSVAHRVLRDSGYAEDITQDIFLDIWRHPDRFDAGRGNFLGWLVVVTRNRSIDLLRNKKTPDCSLDDVALSVPENVNCSVELALLHSAAKSLIAELPTKQKEAVELAFFEGLTHTEIAARTGEALGTIKTRIRLALLALRTGLEKYSQPGRKPTKYAA